MAGEVHSAGSNAVAVADHVRRDADTVSWLCYSGEAETVKPFVYMNAQGFVISHTGVLLSGKTQFVAASAMI